MRKFFVPLLVLSLAALSACNKMTGDVIPPADDAAMEQENASSSEQPAVDVEVDVDAAAGASAVRVIDMTASDWNFAPNAITAKVGEKVVVRLRGVEGSHSFAIDDLGINVEIEPGETKDIEIPTDKAGTFAIRCRVPCGPGHKEMTGQLTVEA